MSDFFIGLLIVAGAFYALHLFTADDQNYSDQTYVVSR
jgi:hypothetical protein